jgi:hypothetical protein
MAKGGRGGNAGRRIDHVGFKGAVADAMKSGHVSKETAEREIGYAKAHASAAAKKANPRLNKTGGRHK